MAKVTFFSISVEVGSTLPKNKIPMAYLESSRITSYIRFLFRRYTSVICRLILLRSTAFLNFRFPTDTNTWQKLDTSLVKKLSYNEWATVAVVFSVLGTVLFLLFYFSYTPSKKRLFFVTSIISFLVLLITSFFTSS